MSAMNSRHAPSPFDDAIPTWRTPLLIIGFGCLISLMSFGPRSSLGLFLTPMSTTHNWGRDVFAFALALQNLLWGVGQPIAGMIADRFGAARVFCAGGLMEGEHTMAWNSDGIWAFAYSVLVTLFFLAWAYVPA
jgi:MFS family permease